MGTGFKSDTGDTLKLNLLLDISLNPKRGPKRRAVNLIDGLARLGIEFDIFGNDYTFAVGISAGARRVFKDLPNYTPLGPNVCHELAGIEEFSGKFKNFIVQADWVANLWKWKDKRAESKQFFVWPPSVDTKGKFAETHLNRTIKGDCLFYTKYQNGENKSQAYSHPLKRGHSIRVIDYGNYDLDQLIDAARSSRYCVFNSCCEKSSHAILEIMACGCPVYVVNSPRWIGEWEFDRCSSAPHFSSECGVIGDFEGKGFDGFLNNLGNYHPRDFVEGGFTIEHNAQRLYDIVRYCYETRNL